MIKKTVTYEDFNGEQVTEDLYFHLSNMELVELEQSTDGGMMKTLETLISAGNAANIIATFRKLVGMAYGKRSEDGKRFIKDEATTQEFLYSPAFDALFEQLIDNPDTAGSFIEGMVSKSLLARVEANRAGDTVQLPAGEGGPPEDPRPAWEREGRDPNNKELMTMHPEQLRDLMRRKMQLTEHTE